MATVILNDTNFYLALISFSKKNFQIILSRNFYIENIATTLYKYKNEWWRTIGVKFHLESPLMLEAIKSYLLELSRNQLTRSSEK